MSLLFLVDYSLMAISFMADLSNPIINTILMIVMLVTLNNVDIRKD
jgi:hypothetical protein